MARAGRWAAAVVTRRPGSRDLWINCAPFAGKHRRHRYTAAVDQGPYDHLLEPLLSELRRHPAGLGEVELIRALRRRGDLEEFPADGSLADPLDLYRTHFILFHALYRLRERLWSEGEDLRIHCLAIALRPRRQAPGALGEPDPMAAFYQDPANLDYYGRADVARLLDGFWRRVGCDRRRGDALEVLGLRDPVSREQIRRRYRRLAMRHHPDRGGDGATLQRLNEAMVTLGLK